MLFKAARAQDKQRAIGRVLETSISSYATCMARFLQLDKQTTSRFPTLYVSDIRMRAKSEITYKSHGKRTLILEGQKSLFVVVSFLSFASIQPFLPSTHGHPLHHSLLPNHSNDIATGYLYGQNRQTDMTSMHSSTPHSFSFRNNDGRNLTFFCVCLLFSFGH